MFTHLLLLLSGDIHPNPGPDNITIQNEMSIMHLNICSLKNKLAVLELDSNKYDIITLSETLLNDTIESESLTLPGFNPIIRNDRKDRGWGGVAIYVKSKFVCKKRPDLEVDGLESVWIETKLGKNVLLVGSIYRSPDQLVAYWNLINESIKKASNTPHRFIVLGDFNTDYLTIPSPHYIGIIQQNNLFQLVNDYTRITGTTKRCIDHILTPNKDIVSNVTVLPPICSDHNIICATLKTAMEQCNYYKKNVMNYSKLNNQKFYEELSQINFMDIVINNTVDDSARIFSDSLLHVAKLCMPVKRIKIRENSPLWINDYILILRDQKNHIHQVAKTYDTQRLWEDFRKFRNFYTDEIRKQKRNYIQQLDDKISNESNFNTKQWWKLVSNFLKNKGTASDDIPPIEVGNETKYSNLDKANSFNEYFNNQSTIVADNDPLPNVNLLDTHLLPFNITIEEVTLIIKSLDTSKAIGPDLIHNKLLIVACPIIAKPLTSLFNRSLAEGTFPDVWKTAHVTPIFKKGDKSLCSNYRPISLLSCVGKVLERCVKNHLVDYLNQNKIISSSQSGFTYGDSTTYQLLNIYDDFAKSVDSYIKTQAVFFDISKAFDRVWHRGLLHKLNAIGITGPLYSWFKSYLADRKQAVVVKGSKSNYLQIKAGVPQGSVLGPILFLIYINDIQNEIQSKIKLFADDTSIYLSLDDDNIRSQILNSDLEQISLWARTWKVNFNRQKTELLNVNRRNVIMGPPLSFESSLLISNPSHKHLGLIIQGDCKWNLHINSLIARCSTLVACLKSYKYRLSRKSLEIMYKSYIIPHFDYADVVWDNCTKQESEQLEQLQLDALRTICGTVRGTSHEEIYKETGFITLKERRKRHKLLLYFKFVNNLLPDHINSKFPKLVSEMNPYHVRRPLERIVPPFNTELYRNTYFPSTTILWNSLNDNSKMLHSISAFKNHLARQDYKVPPYYYSGEREQQITHCRLRLKMSDLKFDLFNRHLSDSIECACGEPREDVKHYLLECQNYVNVRSTTINTLPPSFQLLEILLFGNSNFSLAANHFIFFTVHEFINLSNRFEK